MAVGIEGVERLRVEAAVLGALAHPGVVELVGFTADNGVAELRTVDVDGPPLGAGSLSPEGIAGLAAAVATTLADLHEAGVVHGSLQADHVLLAPTGPVLCGFAGAGPPGPGRQPEDDVTALAQVVLSLVDDGPVAAAARELSRNPLPASDAAQVFGAIAAGDATSRQQARGDAPLRELLRPRRRGPTRRRLVTLVLAGLAGGAALVLLLGGGGGPTATVSPPPPPRPASSVAPTAPAATQVWPSTSVPASPTPTVVVDGRRFVLGEPGDLALAGPFGCNNGPAAVLLRPTTGEVFVFSESAGPGRDTRGVPVTTVPDASALAKGDPDGDGCVDVLAERRGGQPVVIATEVPG